jgi:pantoate--beta-alanine ligase
MLVFRTIAEMRFWLHSRRSLDRSIGFVPTMGALHDGHIALAKRSRELTNDTVVSIFVNPTQFGPNEDLAKYPRPIESDLEKCFDADVAAVFTPDPSEMYDSERFIRFGIDKLGDHLCGKSRPGHFEGVVQVVNKLFNIVNPNIAVFGQKDYQQFKIIERMVHEFNHGLKMIMHPTVREADGLAMSSRNRYLSDDERMKAPMLYAVMKEMELTLRNSPDVAPIIKQAEARLKAAGFKIDYISVVSNTDLQPLNTISGNFVIAVAVYIGTTRLIDNLIIDNQIE